MGTLHCALENGAGLHVNKRQKIRHYRARSTEERRIREELEERRRMPNRDFLLRAVRALYSDVIYSFDWKSAIEHDGGV